MCLSPFALVTFLNLLPIELIETNGNTVIIHAEQGATVWVAKDDLWCTEAPSRPLEAKHKKGS